MSRFNDHRYLDAQLARACEGDLVTDRDRACKGCGYDLTGLRYGGRCPECGRVIRYGRAFEIKERDRLQDAPRLYIRLVQFAFALLVLGAPGVTGLALALTGALTTVADAVPWLLPLAICWSLGAGILAHPKPSTERVRRGLTDDLPLRLATVATQAAWPFAAIMAIPAPWSVTLLGMPLNLLLARAGVFIGLAGFGALAWLVAGFHEWMQDDDGAPRIRRRAFWLIALGVIVLLGGGLRIPVGIPVISLMVGGLNILPFFAVYLVVAMVWTLFTLGRMAAWSVRLKDADAERAQRLRARREAETAAERDRLHNAPIDPPTQYARAPVPKRQSGHGGPDRVAGSDGRR